MIVRTVDFVTGAKEARGIAVIIDVFRAFSVAAYALDRGAECLIPVGAVEDALAWRHRDPRALLIGERHARRIEGFDFGNSPTEICAADVRGRVLIHTTHAGTQGIANAQGADEIVTGSLVNAAATAHYILSRSPREVTLVRMGFEATRRTDEDDICAEYLDAMLLGRSYDTDSIRDRLHASPAAARFFDPKQPWNPESDFILSTDVDRFDFAIRAERDAGVLTLRPVRAER